MPHAPERSRGMRTGKCQVESEVRKSVVIFTKEVLVASWRRRREWGLDCELKRNLVVEKKDTGGPHFTDFYHRILPYFLLPVIFQYCFSSPESMLLCKFLSNLAEFSNICFFFFFFQLGQAHEAKY